LRETTLNYCTNNFKHVESPKNKRKTKQKKQQQTREREREKEREREREREKPPQNPTPQNINKTTEFVKIRNYTIAPPAHFLEPFSKF
jgi:septal ring factor EnvC (AmiA/AmiB activator)